MKRLKVGTDLSGQLVDVEGDPVNPADVVGMTISSFRQSPNGIEMDLVGGFKLADKPINRGSTETCENCEGAGFIETPAISVLCQTCGGTGRIRADMTRPGCWHGTKLPDRCSDYDDLNLP